MMLIETLEAYGKNPRKRLIKQPKVHATDPLLLHHAFGTGFGLQSAQEQGCLGAIYESFIVLEIKKMLESNNLPHKLFTWRTADRAEVDLIIECEGQIIPIEIKYSKHLSRRDISGLQSFLADNPQVKRGYLVHTGREVVELAPEIFAIPDWLLLGIN